LKSIYEEKPWLKEYAAGVPPELLIPSDRSVIDAFNQATEKWANETAFVFYGNQIKYKELRDRVDRLTTALAALGIQKGDRVGLLLLNSPEYVVSSFAIAKIGAVQTPISPVYVSSEIRHQLLDSGAETIICQDILYEGVVKTGVKLKNTILTNISESLPKLKKIMGKSILRGVYQKMAAPTPEIYESEGIYRMQELIAKYPPNPPAVEINPREDLVSLPYTGGTTGSPKGVMITHYNVIANVDQYRQVTKVLDAGRETVVGFMPFYHAAGGMALNHALFTGNTIIILTTPDLDNVLEDIILYKATYFLSAPTMYELLKDYEKTDRVKWKNLKLLVSGADSLNEFTAKDWEERTGTKITEGYGMTETTSVTHFNVLGKERYGSIGIPMVNTDSAVLDPDEDKYLPVGETGEIVVAGPQLTKGYWKRPDATKECVAMIEGKRWWRTGDLGRMDADGYFYIYDRKRDLIKYKGLRVFAREVEEVLKDHPRIKEVGVVGQPDPLVGQNVKAVIVLESDARGKLSERDIMEYCKDKLASYKIPKIIEFVGEIPKTDIGKVSRREIRTQEE
jgi:long-chain acyl-CoA synthetase